MIALALIFTAVFIRNGNATNSSFSVPEGHWRLSISDDFFLRCPYGQTSCVGGDRSGDFLCSETFSGLLCGAPEKYHYIDWVSRDSFQCDDTLVLSSFIIPVMVILLTLIFICRNVGLREGVHQLRDLSILRRTLSLKPVRTWSVSRALPPSPVASGSPILGFTNIHQISRHRPYSAQNATHIDSSAMSTTSSTDEESTDYDTDRNMDLLHKLKILFFVTQV